tara:strand:- start:5334 stop:5618 length:285 start_codon:yes stop_codon:yes gene_type:complete
MILAIPLISAKTIKKIELFSIVPSEKEFIKLGNSEIVFISKKVIMVLKNVASMMNLNPLPYLIIENKFEFNILSKIKTIYFLLILNFLKIQLLI